MQTKAHRTIVECGLTSVLLTTGPLDVLTSSNPVDVGWVAVRTAGPPVGPVGTPGRVPQVWPGRSR